MELLIYSEYIEYIVNSQLMNPWIPYGLPLDPLWNSYKFPMDSHVHFIVLSARKSDPPRTIMNSTMKSLHSFLLFPEKKCPPRTIMNFTMKSLHSGFGPKSTHFEKVCPPELL